MAEKQNLQNRPKVQYRVELEKKIDINKSYSERRNQAIALRILSYGLFGQKRYQNLYLTCSLNCFFYALKIANIIHRRVAGLAMVIKFQTAHVIEYYEEPFEGKTYGQKKYSKINIKLTRTPTKQDQSQAGFNPGLDAKDVQQPLTDVITRKQRPQGLRRGNGRFQRRYNRGGYNRGGYNRGDRGGFRGRGDFRGDSRRPPFRYYNRYETNREQRGTREDNTTGAQVDYRKFRSTKNEQPEQDNNQRRGERRTRGSYQGNNQTSLRSYQRRNQGGYERRGQEQRNFDRRVRNQQSYRNDRENRGARGPQRNYERDSD